MYRKLKHLFNLAPQHGFVVMPFGGTSAMASAEMDPVVNSACGGTLPALSPNSDLFPAF